MSKYYIYRMDVVESDTYLGAYIGQHKIGSKDPSCDGYKGSGSRWKKSILSNHIPVKKTVIRLCDDIDDANYWEEYYIEEAIQNGEFLWNVMKGGGNHESTRIYTAEEIQEHNRIRSQKWYKNNKEHHAEVCKLYRVRNREHVRLIRANYRGKHKEFYTDYHKRYYKAHKTELSEKNRQWYEQHKEEIAEQRKEYGKQYRLTHAEQESERHRRYYEEHKDERKKYYERPCLYDGEIITFRAVTLRLRRKHIPNPTQAAKQYLIKEGELI